MQALEDSTFLKIGRNFEMPSVPTVLTKILQLVDDDRASAKQLEELILHDPSLSARILKLANSAFYSFRSEVKTISHAITLLGLNLVKSLAIGVSIFESYMKGFVNETELINSLWMHSFSVGFLAQEIWKGRSDRSEGEFALLCGLLHDLGKVVFFKEDAAEYSKLFSMEKGDSDPDISRCEIERYGLSHAAIGSMLAKRWGLPPDLAEVVRCHHDAANSEMPLAAAVSIADSVAKCAGAGFDGDSQASHDLERLQKSLDMSPQEYERLYQKAENQREDVQSFFALVR